MPAISASPDSRTPLGIFANKYWQLHIHRDSHTPGKIHAYLSGKMNGFPNFTTLSSMAHRTFGNDAVFGHGKDIDCMSTDENSGYTVYINKPEFIADLLTMHKRAGQKLSIGLAIEKDFFERSGQLDFLKKAPHPSPLLMGILKKCGIDASTMSFIEPKIYTHEMMRDAERERARIEQLQLDSLLPEIAKTGAVSRA